MAVIIKRIARMVSVIIMDIETPSLQSVPELYGKYTPRLTYFVPERIA